MAVTNKSQLASATATQQALYNQELVRQAKLNNQQKYMQMAQNNPWFAFGNMIGNALVDNYNSRGVNKEKQAISDALASYNGNQNYDSMNNILNSGLFTDTIPVNNQNSISGGLGDNLGTITMPDSNAYGITVSPAPATQVSDFDVDKFKSQYYEDARRRGRSTAQIDEAWSNMQPQITDLANKAKEARIDNAFAALSPETDGTYSFGEMSMSNPEFIKTLRPLAKDAPELATLLVKGATARDTERYGTQKQNALFAHQDATQARQQQFTTNLHNLDNAIKMAIANGKVAKNGIATDYKTALSAGKAYDLLEKKYTATDPTNPMQTKVLPFEKWSPLDQMRAKQYAALMGVNLGGQDAGAGQKKVAYNKLPNPNNYELTLSEIGKAISKLSQDPNKGKNDIINAIRGQYGKQFGNNTGYVDQILQGITDEEWRGYGVRGI